MTAITRFLVLLTAATAFAQPTQAAPSREASFTPFNIPAQPLPAALAEYSRQSGVRVQYDAGSASELLSQAVVGDYAPAEALALLLEGTGLEPRFETPAVALVTRSGQTRVYSLPALTVVAARGRGYATTRTMSATRTDTPIRDTPQSVSVVMRDVIADQSMLSMADVVRYIPGITMGQGEGHRDAPTIRGNSTTADFFVDGVRDDVQYYRDLYNVERVEALKGSNAMVFGRGGGGGVLNRVTKEAVWAPVRMLTAATGSYDYRRSTVDVGQAFSNLFAARFNGMYENSGGFRDEAKLERFGVNPTVAFSLGDATTARGSYEYFSEDRNVDRGIPSFQGRPSNADITTFFGNPDSSYATARVHAAGALIEHASSRGITVRNRTRFAHYDKFYTNSLPGAVDATGTQVTLSAYSNETNRSNVFNQTDVIVARMTGTVKHTLLMGAELGRQNTKNFRNTGYYNNTSTSFTALFEDPTVSTPITFRQSATDTDSRTVANIAAAYVQDQVELSDKWQAIAGVRFERFGLEFENNRNGDMFERTDNLIAPRGGLVFKPVSTASLYASYGVAYLPSSGDQFGSLTVTSRTLEPEQFRNYEVGAKWDVRPNFAVTTALYSLDRTNTTAPDPADATRLVQTGSQRTRGVELGASGSLTKSWQLIAGAAFQDAEITSRTTAAAAGAQVALVPARTFSLWNRYQALEWLGLGVGVVEQSEMYAAIDNSVTLPGFTRADAALFLRIGSIAAIQLNMENVFDTRYYITSHGNNNIMPGASRTLRLSLTTRH
jgi:catecholate siderophore receptor